MVGKSRGQVSLLQNDPPFHIHALYPAQAELLSLRVGEAFERIPARPNQRIPYEGNLKTSKHPPQLKPDPFEGTWEVLTTDEKGSPFLDR